MSDETTRRTFIAACAAGMAPADQPVKGDLRNWRKLNLPKSLAPAFEYLESGAWKSLDAGKHLIDGDNLFVNVVKGETHDPSTGRFEAHRRYADIHYMASGSEMIGFAPPESLKVVQEYQEKDDVLFYSVPADYSKPVIKPGQFLVFMAGQPHLPDCDAKGRSKFHKAVMKVRV